nr:hypothetical protein [Candidatus Enterousia merdequi]
MKKYILIILPIMMVSSLSFGQADAGIVDDFQPNSEIPASCNVHYLGVAEDNAIADVDAGFRPNVMTINWAASHGVQVGTTQKTVNQYDGKVQKPMGIRPKQGYKFVGWKVSGVKTCADFSGGTAEECVSHQNCIWKDNACVPNPCVVCGMGLAQKDGSIDNLCRYTEYNYKTGECENVQSAEETIRDTD